MSLLQQYNAAFDRIQQRHRKRRAIKLERKHLQDRAAKARTELYAMTDRAARGDDDLSLSSRFSSIEGTLGDVEDGLTPGGVQWTELFETTIELFADLGSVVSQYSAAITPVTNGLKRLLVIYKATAHVRAQTDEVLVFVMDIVRMIRNLIHDDADTFSEKTQVEVKRLTSACQRAILIIAEAHKRSYWQTALSPNYFASQLQSAKDDLKRQYDNLKTAAALRSEQLTCELHRLRLPEIRSENKAIKADTEAILARVEAIVAWVDSLESHGIDVVRGVHVLRAQRERLSCDIAQCRRERRGNVGMGKHGAAAFALHCFIIHGIYHVNEKSIVMDMELRLERLDIDIDFFVGLVDFKLHRHAVITRLTAGPVPSLVTDSAESSTSTRKRQEQRIVAPQPIIPEVIETSAAKPSVGNNTQPLFPVLGKQGIVGARQPLYRRHSAVF